MAGLVRQSTKKKPSAPPAGATSILPWAPADWSLSGWQTGQPGNLFAMAGLRNLGLQYPKLTAKLPGAVGSADSSGAKNTGGSGSQGSGKVPQKGAYQSYARKKLAARGWGSQWDDFNNIVMAESSWNSTVSNTQGSGAYGIAQALGHGDAATQGTYSDAYGGYGLTDKQARAANSGNGYDQIDWMLNYIADTYGSPANAWQYHLANGAY